ncbi:non-specific lipid-transfer protein 2-like [Coffea arabica]|uniref:Non-specific lipid-transfer protein 2-like n=1 Tax=Coffea arabica TaxID=13443 RepID=A0A6P6TLX4_COFAR|nr:non-specific lipid-transfer protein 2-like [Coffea arabica]
MKLSQMRLCSVLLLVVVIVGEVEVSRAVTCTPTELSPCVAAIIGQQPPSAACCSKLREQRPCLCGYLRDPNLRQYVNSPNARRVASSCGVPTPRC